MAIEPRRDLPVDSPVETTGPAPIVRAQSEETPARIARLTERAARIGAGLDELSTELEPRKLAALSFVQALAEAVSPAVSPGEAPPEPAEAGEVDPGPRDAAVVAAIGSGAHTTREIAEVVGLSAASVLRLLRSLEVDGAVSSSPGPGRSRRWELPAPSA